MSEQVKTRFSSSIIWSIVTRWSSKLIGMINTIVLARILAPEDFGIVAMATIVMVMLDSMTQIGVHLYVFRQKEDDTRVFNTGWTVNFIQACVIATVLVIAAPWIAEFFGETAVQNIVYCLAAIKIIKGLQNFGIFIAQKQLQFDIDFKLTFYSRVVYMVATIAFALWLESYWAIILGQLASAFSAVILSYRLHPFRPKFELYQWRDMFTFSKATLPMSFGRFINNQADVAIIGRVAPAEFLGQYHVASNLASLFTKELMMPFIRGLIPNLSKIKETDSFNNVLRLVIASAVYVFLPLGIGLALVATEFVYLLLGEKWLDTAPVLAWLSLYAMLSGMMMFISEQFLIILDHEKLSNRLMWLRNVILLAVIFLVLSIGHYQDLPQAIVVSALIAFPITLFFVARALKLSIFFIIAQWWPAVLAVLVMASAIAFTPWPSFSLVVLLLLKSSVGGACYLLTIVGLYYLRGQPADTPEQLILRKLVKS